ncbi:MAG: glycerol acyltransferase [Flavobacteriaceae bacterium]|nr:glycerol acyltransferase [Flavobacteriaceae bacterium]
MKRCIAKFILFVSGWKADYPDQFKVPKSVMLAAPHTSNWDIVYALAVYWLEGIDAKFLIKDAYTNGFFGFFFRWLGAIGVDRSKNNNLVDYSIQLFNSFEKLILMVPAEGTRRRVEKWKTGFYHIANSAKVPVSFGYLDYQKKIAGVGNVYELSGDFKEDMQIIEDFYAHIEPNHPELYNKKIF